MLAISRPPRSSRAQASSFRQHRDEQGGEMVLLSPQPIVARVLSLMGADQMITVRLGPETQAEAI
jgi:anti-anti-sigma regulatory factor